VKIKYEIEEYDPEREYILVKFTSEENSDHQFYRSLNPPDFSAEKLTELLEAVASVAAGFWERAEKHDKECPIPLDGTVDVEPEVYMAQEIFPVIEPYPEYDPWTERIEQGHLTSPYQETIGWDIFKLTEAEQKEVYENMEMGFRLDRNQTLLECDFVLQPDAVVANIEEWKDYRQKLRDLPTASGWPKNIVWPDVPELKKS
jgi:hypothetical protein